MGEPMAANIVRAGFTLMAFDVRPEPVERLVALGATAGASVADIGAHSDVVLVNVVDDAQVREVVLGAKDDGLLGSGRTGAAGRVPHTRHPPACRRPPHAPAAP